MNNPFILPNGRVNMAEYKERMEKMHFYELYSRALELSTYLNKLGFPFEGVTEYIEEQWQTASLYIYKRERNNAMILFDTFLDGSNGKDPFIRFVNVLCERNILSEEEKEKALELFETMYPFKELP